MDYVDGKFKMLMFCFLDPILETFLNLNKICFTFVINVALDPALTDPLLAQKLRANREVALSSLEEVINKYANKQDDTEEEERRKRLEKEKQKKEVKRVKKKWEGNDL